MILWQFIVLMVFLVWCNWAAEQRENKRSEQLNRLLGELSDIENRLIPLVDMPIEIARSIHAEGAKRQEYFLRTGTEKPY